MRWNYSHAQVRCNKCDLVNVVGVKGEGNKSQVDKYMAVNNAVMVTNH